MSAVIEVSIKGCARCGGEGHENVRFAPLTFPVGFDSDERSLTHWAPCPTNGEPILLRITDDVA